MPLLPIPTFSPAGASALLPGCSWKLPTLEGHNISTFVRLQRMNNMHSIMDKHRLGLLHLNDATLSPARQNVKVLIMAAEKEINGAPFSPSTYSKTFYQFRRDFLVAYQDLHNVIRCAIAFNRTETLFFRYFSTANLKSRPSISQVSPSSSCTSTSYSHYSRCHWQEAEVEEGS